MANVRQENKTPCPFYIFEQPKYFGGKGRFNHAYGKTRVKSAKERKAIGDGQRGMPKHTEEQKAKFSRDRKGVYEPVGTGGTVAYNDGVKEYRVRHGQPIDPSWKRGGLPRTLKPTDKRYHANRQQAL